MNYYNDNNPKCAAALRQLIADGLIPKGEVDDRPIEQVQPSDLDGFIQCHFFAGIGGWSLALQLAGWTADRPVWTGSCPCQPFSGAGKKAKQSDERHLWPNWSRLIRECRPATIFGEQVASAVNAGWLDDVFFDLEEAAYACASAILPACAVGAPHRRDRLWFVADRQMPECESTRPSRDGRAGSSNNHSRDGGLLRIGALGDAGRARGKARLPAPARRSQRYTKIIDDGGHRISRPWKDGQWIECADGKKRLINPAIRLLAHGISERVDLISSGGNAIVPQIAAEFIISYREAIGE